MATCKLLVFYIMCWHPQSMNKNLQLFTFWRESLEIERVSKLLDVFSIGTVRPSNQAFCFKGPKLRIDWPEKVAELLFYI